MLSDEVHNVIELHHMYTIFYTVKTSYTHSKHSCLLALAFNPFYIE